MIMIASGCKTPLPSIMLISKQNRRIIYENLFKGTSTHAVFPEHLY
jgi:hypothetical protein